MQFFDMGPLELLLILAIALIVFGPAKLPEIANTFGKTMQKFRAVTTGLTRDFSKEITQELDGVKKDATTTPEVVEEKENKSKA